jgi:hypothetical protein
MRRLLSLALCCSLSALSGEAFAAPPAPDTYDVVVYGGTSAGVAAAVQVKRQGGTVVLIEPTRRLGGLTTGGLGQTDIGNKAAIGGIAREFYARVKKYYDRPEAWKWQKREQYKDGGQTQTGKTEETMWTFEPSAALQIINELVKEHDVPVVYGERLDRAGDAPDKTTTKTLARGVKTQGNRISEIVMESGRSFRGRVFIDATYEGDLLAGAGVSYTVGREANATYGETLNGVQTRQAKSHQLRPGVDPYVTKGDKSSGLLPGIDPSGPGEEGGADRRVQAYCYRMCLTDHPENRIPFEKPADYDAKNYELLLRNFEAGENGSPWINSSMPNRKTDTNNRTGFSTDFIGQNYAWPEASYEERDAIAAKHLAYQKGLMWTLANDPRVPEKIRNEFARWGMCRDEFDQADGGWQRQIYVREGRRMVGAVVMTQHHCQGRTKAEQPVGLAAYTMDSHNVQRYVGADGFAHNEGDVQVGGFSPYPIAYGSITPKQEECDNLLAPVALSASHIAFGSIRMEPVFMVLGQSAASAALEAKGADAAVQAIDYAKLEARLKADQQVLEWTGPVKTPAQALDAKTLPGLVVDDEQAKLTGFSGTSSLIGPFVGVGYRHDEGKDPGTQSAVYTFQVAKPGRYDVRVAYTPNGNRGTKIPVTIRQNGKSIAATMNQRKAPADPPFARVMVFELAAGEATVEISNTGVDGFVVIDAVQLLPSE